MACHFHSVQNNCNVDETDTLNGLTVTKARRNFLFRHLYYRMQFIHNNIL